jgi:hypothetical protein
MDGWAACERNLENAKAYHAPRKLSNEKRRRNEKAGSRHSKTPLAAGMHKAVPRKSSKNSAATLDGLRWRRMVDRGICEKHIISQAVFAPAGRASGTFAREHGRR